MKSPFSKLKRFALHKSDGSKDKRDFLPSALVDELAQAAQEMQDMRDCYDSLLSSAAATANSAYEFSESLREMGSCLLEKTALHDNEASGRVLLMLGKVQFELQKLVDSYRSHIFLTITNPSESLLNELRTVEDMKRQCDEKRNVYEYMMTQQKEKGKSKSSKGETFTLQQLRTAHDEYDEEATLCVFRLKSLKQGQSRSLLTQIARHHAAQLNFFRKGLKSLEAVEPHVRVIAEQHHIDYQFCGLEDDDGEAAKGDDGDGDDASEDGELSFDYRRNKPGLDAVSTSRNSMEVDEVGSFPQASTVENAELDIDKDQGDFWFPSKEPRVGSHSAPIFAERKVDPTEKVRQMWQSTTRRANTYVLPTPSDAKGAVPSRSSSSVPRTRPPPHNLWYSSPFEQKRNEEDSGDGHLPEVTVLKVESVLKESNNYNAPRRPPPLADGLSLPQYDTSTAVYSKKFKKQAFSGPIASKPSSAKPVSSTSGPITSEFPVLVQSGVHSRVSISQQPSSPKLSPSASPPLGSSPRISELHELPRPPGTLPTKTAKSPGRIGHSAPLVFRNQELTALNKMPLEASNATASRLPTPPLIISRSYSIPTSSQRSMALHVPKHFKSPQVLDKAEEVASPPLTPISLTKSRLVSSVSETVPQFSLRGG
ncbi:BAR domain-containing protein [Cephalotus follicularis]|uniref:BAR domain-containing protein n=1 Tax=Cephalotus follicularis TaxID=3775 RepID=A0A1Q3DF76_CEPFO|nr:BAR domain-containing protein [Cephalotus follicularis]